MLTNPLPVGRYQLDLWSPTDAKPVKDGVPVFNKWRERNAERVKVLHAECWNTEPRQTRVMFEVHAKPGAFPFGQLGKPVMVAEVGSAATFVDAVQFLMDPLGTLEASAAEAAGHFLRELAAPELAHVRDAINIARVNIATIRALLESIANHTSPDPLSAIATCKQLITTSLEALTAALGAAPGDFARRIVSQVIADLNHLAQAIEDAPARALKAAVQVAKDVLIPESVFGTGALLVAGAVALWWFQDKKRSSEGDTLLLVGAAAMLLGGGTLFENLTHPADHAGKTARILKGEE